LVFLEPQLYTQYPVLNAYQNNVANLPKLKEYLADPNCLEKTRTFNNKSAKVNNQIA
jgi:hypothetical protein